MKVGKLTQDGYGNYGNILQNYALQEFLQNYADTVDSIWHSPSKLLGDYWKWGLKGDVKFLLNYKDFRSKVKSGYAAWEYVRNARFYDFSQRYIHNVNQKGTLDDLADQYDFFVTGSDQVWKPTYRRLEHTFLRFAPKEKRVSFAASMGVERIPVEREDYYRECLNEMHAISVREESAARIIEELTGRKSTVVLDPCFCLDETQWRAISDTPYWIPEKKYMFSYFLGPKPKEIDQIARKYNLENMQAFNRDNFYQATMSPQEWIALIDRAEIVYTDSFHCAVFSMIFHKPFVICDRIGDAKAQEMRTRIYTLLGKFNLMDRFVSRESEYEIMDPMDISYVGTDVILHEELAKSDLFVQEAFRAQ